MLKVKNLFKEFPSGEIKVKAVQDINFEVPEGAFASIIGKSGSGKSTLLSFLGALDQPTSGTVEVDGQDIGKMSERVKACYRSRKIGFIFQSYNLIPNLSARENVMLALEFGRWPKAKRFERAERLLNAVGITADKQLRRPTRLSGGEQQRVAIARALANEPKLILADEPTGNLDSQTGKMIFVLLHNLARTEKTTIVVVTHDLSIAGNTNTDMIFHLKDGKMIKS